MSEVDIYPDATHDAGTPLEDRRSEERIHKEINYFRNFSAVYTDAIRASDFKANIALLFLPLLMVPVLQSHQDHFVQVPLWVILAPFLFAYFFLILSIFPRFLRTEKSSFHLSHKAEPAHFVYIHDPLEELDEAKHRIALLSRILFWKTLYVRLSLGICLAAIPVFGVLLAVYGV
jgi:hypothetical protein